MINVLVWWQSGFVLTNILPTRAPSPLFLEKIKQTGKHAQLVTGTVLVRSCPSDVGGVVKILLSFLEFFT